MSPARYCWLPWPLPQQPERPSIRFDDSDRSLSEAHDRASFPKFTPDKRGIDAATALRDHCQAFLDEQEARDQAALMKLYEDEVPR